MRKRSGEELKRVGEEMLPLFFDGVVARELAIAWELDSNEVQYALRAAGYRPGMKRKTQKRQMTLVKHAAPPTREIEIIALVRGGNSFTEIGDAYGITRERVRQIARKAGFTGTTTGHVDPIRVV